MSLLDLRTGFWGLAASLLMAASFPHAWGNGSIDLGLGLAWVAPAALAMALGERKPLPTGLCAFAVGWLTHAIIFHWIYIAAVRYGGAPPAVGAIAVGGLALYPALFVGLFGAGWARLRALGAPAALLGGALWAALDHGRSVFLTGFPWALLGYTQHENPWLLPLAAWGGVYGLSFVVATVGLGVALAARAAAGGGARVPAAVVAVVFCLAHGLGAVALWAQGEGEAGPSLRIGVVQGNIDQGQKWDPEAAVRTLTLYEELTREAAARGAVLVLWPETAAPGFPEPVPPGLGSNPLRDRLRRLSEETGVVLVAGALGGEPSAARDSAFVFAPGVPGWQRYDKSHLVPFGEYLPFRRFIGGFVNAIARGSASTDVQAGPGPRALEIPELASVGVPICYELLFPDLVRRFRAEGAELLLAMTNDAWYGRSGAPYQFLAITALRSAESGVWTARAANTGVSALIDGRGRVREQTKIFERDVLVADVPTRTGPPTLYARVGDRLIWMCWGAVAVGLLISGLRTRRGRAPADAGVATENGTEGTRE